MVGIFLVGRSIFFCFLDRVKKSYEGGYNKKNGWLNFFFKG